MDDVAIRVDGLGKRYRIGAWQPYHSLRESLVRSVLAPFRRAAAPPPERDLWALKDVSFEVRRGEIVGVIGRNGAGKSTLLKILSRITDPTEGRAEVRGRVRALLEVGTGFHMELTGRENVYVNGAMLGMKRAEIDRKFGEIVAFAEVEKFLDTPVKHYSSGMYLRLAFSVAAHLEPEILLVDEVLAVGDAQFQKRCLGKMGEVARGGRTVLLVSHSMAAIRALCTTALLIDAGALARSGEPGSVIEAYLRRQPVPASAGLADRADRRGDGSIRWTSAALEDADGRPVTTFLSGEGAVLRLGFAASRPIPAQATLLAAAVVKSDLDQPLFTCNNELTGEAAHGWPERGELTCSIPRLPLTTGVYKVDLFLSVNGTESDWLVDAFRFEVHDAGFFGTGRVPEPALHGNVLVPHAWRVAAGAP